jgi:hypothetical protein
MCAEATTLRRIRCTFTRQKWNEIFTGNRTRLKIVRLERMTFIERKVAPSPNHLLPNVSGLDVSFNSFGHSIHMDRTRIPCRKAEAFAVMLPNLEEIDLSHTTVPRDCIARFLFS